MDHLIVIAGIKRSGSTWVYNVVRLLCESVSNDISVSGQDYDLENIAEYYIVKVHPFFRDLAEKADHIFTSDRPDKRIQESLNRAFGDETTLDRVRRMRKKLNVWNEYADYCVPFQSIYGQPLRVVQHIATVLGIQANYKKILSDVNHVKPPTNQKRDPVTFLFQNHITIEGQHE